MRLLLDTHVLAWAVLDVGKLSTAASQDIESRQNTILVSVVSAWEMAIKVGTGKWPGAAPLVNAFETEIGVAGFELLPITIPHVRASGLMASPHRDPFDRLLAAQALIEGLTLVTADQKVAALGAPVLW